LTVGTSMATRCVPEGAAMLLVMLVLWLWNTPAH